MNEIKQMPFIWQTAKDYDISYEIVEKLFNAYWPNEFYEQLETYIENRANS